MNEAGEMHELESSSLLLIREGAAAGATATRVAGLYRQHRDQVYRLALRYGRGDRTWAEDVTQDVFVSLCKVIDQLQDDEGLKGWFYRVATNHCFNVRRNASRRGEDAAMPDLELADSTPADMYPNRALAQQVLSQFDETTRSVAVGVLVDGMEHEEIAEVLGISRRTVARKLERFLDTARAYLART